MSEQISDCKTPLDEARMHEQFTPVLEAIREGEYSWACFLLLRFFDCNPLDYLPYRTYIRLVKKAASSPAGRGAARLWQPVGQRTNKINLIGHRSETQDLRTDT